MKHIVTFAAAAALMAGVSIANAQTTKSGTMTKSGASADNGQYCLDRNGSKNCKYPTLAACQKDVGGSGGKCDKNPSFAAKGGMKSNAMEPKSGAMKKGDDMKKSSPMKQESDSVKKQ